MKSNGTTVSSIEYTFDACSRVTNKDEYGVGETDYVYDYEGQLTQVDYPSGETHTFTYDDNGNRLQWTRTDGPTTTYAYNAADQLTQSTDGTLGTSYTHDNNGNLASETTSGVTRSYNYDSFDRMTSVVEGSTVQSMTYGPDGKRLSLTDASGTRKFFYDFNDVIQEYNSSWSSVTKEYTHGPWVDEPLSMTDKTSEPNTTHYLMKDRLGSIINILDSNETVKTTYSYDAFGEPTATYHSGQVDCMYRFTGRAYDTAMGNYFYRARYYNQSLGRFFSRDPIFSLQSLYAYCANSPTNFTDPMGLRASELPSGGICEFYVCPIIWGLFLGEGKSVVDGDKSLIITKPDKSPDPWAMQNEMITLCIVIGAFFWACGSLAGATTLLATVGIVLTIFGAVLYFDYLMRKHFGGCTEHSDLWPRVYSSAPI